MQKPYWLITGAIALSAIVGASLAVARMGENTVAVTPSPTPSPTASPIVATAPTPKPSAQQPDAESSPPVIARDPASKPIVLKDEAQPGGDFFQFRQRLRQAVQKRDAAFVKATLPADGIALGFGRPILPNELNLEDPQTHFWNLLEKAIAPGCTEDSNEKHPEVSPDAPVWICPNVLAAFYEQYPKPSSEPGIEYELNHLVVVGENVNVRSQASTKSPVVGVLSNEVVRFDRPAFDQQLQANPNQDFNPINGWSPIILPNGRKGYVSNRYAYAPLEYRAIFAKVEGQWQLVRMPGGD